jgi:hypothetical protein
MLFFAPYQKRHTKMRARRAVPRAAAAACFLLHRERCRLLSTTERKILLFTPRKLHSLQTHQHIQFALRLAAAAAAAMAHRHTRAHGGVCT